MRSNRHRFDEVKHLINMLALDILQKMRVDDIGGLDSMLARWIELIEELRSFYPVEPDKVKDSLMQFGVYEREMRALSEGMLKQLNQALKNAEKMTDGIV